MDDVIDLQAMLADLELLVNTESPSLDVSSRALPSSGGLSSSTQTAKSVQSTSAKPRATSQRRRLGTVAPREDRDLASLILQLAREFLHNRCFARATHREITHGDDLHAERGVAEDADVVEEEAELHEEREDFRAGEEHAPQRSGALALALLEDDFEHEGLGVFQPVAERLGHGGGLCLRAVREEKGLVADRGGMSFPRGRFSSRPLASDIAW